MKRLTRDDLAFYDRVAARVRTLLRRRDRRMSQSALAARIGWNRSSLCNFLNRSQKMIPAHFISEIAEALRVPIDELMCDQSHEATGNGDGDSHLE